jgi:hypothetical protein
VGVGKAHDLRGKAHDLLRDLPSRPLHFTAQILTKSGAYVIMNTGDEMHIAAKKFGYRVSKRKKGEYEL